MFISPFIGVLYLSQILSVAYCDVDLFFNSSETSSVSETDSVIFSGERTSKRLQFDADFSKKIQPDRSYVVLWKHTASTDLDYILNLCEVDLYLDDARVPDSALSISMSSDYGDGYHPQYCNNNDSGDSCCSSGWNDLNPYLLVDSNQVLFNRIVVTNGWHNSDSIVIEVYIKGLLIGTKYFVDHGISSYLSTYTFMFCLPGTYSTAGATSCSLCPQYSSSDYNANTCTCNSGFESSGFGSTLLCTCSTIPSCASCTENTYRSTEGASSCLQCPSYSTSKAELWDCVCGGVASSSSKPGTSCTCNTGFISSGSGSSLVCACSEPGTYMDASDSTGCYTCPPGTTSTGGLATCTNCGGVTYSPTAGSKGCSICSGTSLAIDGGMVCCRDNEYNTYGSGQCSLCPVGSTSVAGSSICSCSSEYIQVARTLYSNCPPGYTYFQALSKCYKYISKTNSVYNNRLSWGEANNQCNSASLSYGWLVTISTVEENAAIVSLINDNSWIGLNCNNCLSRVKSEYKFIQGTSSLDNWSNREPTGGSESCAFITPSGNWFDTNCSILQSYVCENKPYVSTPVCKTNDRSYVVLRKHTASTDLDYILNLCEVDLYLDDARVPDSALSISMSSDYGDGYHPQYCNNNDSGDSCCSSGWNDLNPYLLVDSNQVLFNRIVVTNGWHNSDSIVIEVYIKGLLIGTKYFVDHGISSYLSTYTFMFCLPGTYSTAEATSCSLCPQYSSSDYNANTCTCNSGFESSGFGSTLLCTKPTVTDYNGSSCPSNSYLSRGDSIGHSAGDCVCMRGFTPSLQTPMHCSPCPYGESTAQDGSSECVPTHSVKVLSEKKCPGYRSIRNLLPSGSVSVKYIPTSEEKMLIFTGVTDQFYDTVSTVEARFVFSYHKENVDGQNFPGVLTKKDDSVEQRFLLAVPPYSGKTYFHLSFPSCVEHLLQPGQYISKLRLKYYMVQPDAMLTTDKVVGCKDYHLDPNSAFNVSSGVCTADPHYFSLSFDLLSEHKTTSVIRSARSLT